MSTPFSDLLAGLPGPRVRDSRVQKGAPGGRRWNRPFTCKSPGQCEQINRKPVCRQCRAAIKAKMDTIKARERALLAETVRQRKILRPMLPKERAKLLRARQIAFAARIDANDTTDTGRVPSNLLSLPPEIREKIYDALWKDNPPYPIELPRPSYAPRGSKLHRACRLLRKEVKRYFFLRTQFVSRNCLALDSWFQTHTVDLSLIRSIEMVFSDTSPIVRFAAHFQNLRTLVLLAKLGWGISYGEVREVYNSLGRVIAWRQLEIIHNALPQFQKGVVEVSHRVATGGARKIRFRLDEPPQVPNFDPLVSCSSIDMKVVKGNIDWLVPRMAAQKPFQSYVMDGITYAGCRDFVRRALGRDPTPWYFYEDLMEQMDDPHSCLST